MPDQMLKPFEVFSVSNAFILTKTTQLHIVITSCSQAFLFEGWQDISSSPSLIAHRRIRINVHEEPVRSVLICEVSVCFASGQGSKSSTWAWLYSHGSQLKWRMLVDSMLIQEWWLLNVWWESLCSIQQNVQLSSDFPVIMWNGKDVVVLLTLQRGLMKPVEQKLIHVKFM